MDQTTSQIEQHIYEERQDLGDNIQELRQRVRNSLDWRLQVEEHPLTMTGLAFGLGVMLSVLSRRSQPGYADSERGYDGRTRREWSTVKAALASAILAQGTELAKQVIPHFGEEYKRRQRENSSPAEGRSSSSPDYGP